MEEGSRAGGTRSASPRGGTVADAIEFARRAHQGELGKDGSPYARHTEAVAQLVKETGFDDSVVVAALLHDVVEHSAIPLDDVKDRFGAKVAELVEAMSEDAKIPFYEQRKRAHRFAVDSAGPEAQAIYAADKLAKVRELRAAYRNRGEDVATTMKAPLDVRLQLWQEDLEMLAQRIRELPILADLELELRGLRADRARRAADESSPPEAGV